MVCGFFQTELTEFDDNYVLMPLPVLQRMQGMEGRVTTVHLNLRDYAAAPRVAARLKQLFEGTSLAVRTWEERQAPLLAAVEIEKGLLNVLLLMIVAVAGFITLAVFSIIVRDKTRDIGVVKSLGASSGGVLRVFLGYGLLLGLAGGALGTLLGVALTAHLDEVEWLLARMTGQDIFPRDVFYFDRIPTVLEPVTVAMINLGAVLSAVLSSVVPAARAARMHPVLALRAD